MSEEKHDVLEKLIQLFKEKGPAIKVGILTNTARTEKNAGDSGAVSDLGNADVGAIHEFGGWVKGARIPRRSFLVMPLTTQFKKFLKEADITAVTFDKALEEGNLDPVARKLARVAKSCVLGAFETQGYGIWPPHSPNYSNATGNLLDDTGQLKGAIDTEIVKKG